MTKLDGNASSISLVFIHTPRCQKAVRAQKQLTVYKPPNILIVTLKRFDLLQNGAKINKPVLFREDLSLKKLMSQNTPVPLFFFTSFHLFRKQKQNTTFMQLLFTMAQLYFQVFVTSTLYHTGHYVAFVKTEDYWTLFDDTKVSHSIFDKE